MATKWPFLQTLFSNSGYSKILGQGPNITFQLGTPQGAPLKSSENQIQKTRSELAIAEEEGKSGGESAEEKSPPLFPPPPQSLTRSILPSSLLLRRCCAGLMCLTGRGRVEH